MKANLFILLEIAVLIIGCSRQNGELITAFGAVADGKTNNAASIQQAIDKVSAAGGGQVIVPPGNFMSGPVFLKSGVNLHLQLGACLLGPTNRSDYGIEKGRPAIVSATNQNNISISGNGIINGKTDESTVSISSTNPGTLQLTVIEISAAGCRKDTFMTISIANPQGINELKSEQISILSIQPNPSDNSQILNIVCEFPLMTSPIIELVDMLGIVHYSMQSMQSKDESIQHIAIPLSKISSGMYIIRLRTNTQTVSQKFLIH